MRKLFILFATLASLEAFGGTCGNGYSYGPITITLQRASVADQTNFPYLISSKWAPSSLATAMKTAINGGQIQNTANNGLGFSGPADLVFCDAASAGNALKYEVVNYDPTGAAGFEFWVQIPTLHTASSDQIYLFANNSSVVTTQQDSGLGTTSNMWTDASYISVVHHTATTGTLNATDSSGTSNGTVNSATSIAGQIGGGSAYSGTSQYIQFGTTTTLNPSPMSVEYWSKIGSTSATVNILSSKGDGTNGWDNYEVSGTLNWQIVASSAVSLIRSGATIDTNLWNYVVGTSTAAPNSASNFKLYINKANDTGRSGTGYAAASIPTTAFSMDFGQRPSGSALSYTGDLDEHRIRSVVDDANWIKTNWNIQNGSSTAYATSIGVSGARVVQSKVCTADSTSSGWTTSSLSCAFPLPLTSGNLAVIGVAAQGSPLVATDCASPGSHFTDTASNTYSLLVSVNNGGGTGTGNCILTAAVSSSTYDTVTYSATSTAPTAMVLLEIGGITSPASDVSSTGTASGTTTVSSGSATATTSHSLLLCVGNGYIASAPSTYTSYTPAGATQIGVFNLGLSGVNGLSAIFIYQFTGSGSTSCSFTSPVGNTQSAASLGIIKYTPTTGSIRHRVIWE